MVIIMWVDSAVFSHLGSIRKNNEDNYFLHGQMHDNLSEFISQKEYQGNGKQFVFAVCDGMGGEEDGEIASLCAVKNLSVFLECVPSSHMEDTLAAYLSGVKESMQAQLSGGEGGCTVCILILEDDKAYAYNLGDSRIYHYCDNKLIQISVDHTQAQLLVNGGLLKKEEARRHKGGHILTRCLSVEKESHAEDFFQAKPVNIQKEELFLLCSDGLTDMLADSELEQYIRDYQKENALCIAKILCEKALEAGGRDNITCLVVKSGYEKPKGMGFFRKLIRSC